MSMTYNSNILGSINYYSQLQRSRQLEEERNTIFQSECDPYNDEFKCEKIQGCELTNIYFIQVYKSGAGPIKIGHSRNLISRFQSINGANPYELRYKCIIWNVRKEIETKFHQYYRESKVKNEWFEKHCFDKELILQICGEEKERLINKYNLNNREAKKIAMANFYINM